jgi:mannose-6-phosphate isomerase-like protein (cupin superfamily)
MRIVHIQDRKYFSPPGSAAEVSILSGKAQEQGSFEKHTVAIVKLPAGSRLDQHFHKEREESYFILSGSGSITVDGKQTQVGPGDLVSVAPRETHLLEASQNQPLEYVVVTAPAWTLEDVHRT